MIVPAIFAIAVSAMLLIVWASGNHVLQKLGLILLLAWASTSVAVEYMGFARAPLIIPSIHAALAIMVAIVGYRQRSFVPKVIFGLYCAMVTLDLGAFALRIQGTYTYYLTLNLFFLAQLLTVGATGAWFALRGWVLPRSERPSVGASRRPDMG